MYKCSLEDVADQKVPSKGLQWNLQRVEAALRLLCERGYVQTVGNRAQGLGCVCGIFLGSERASTPVAPTSRHGSLVILCRPRRQHYREKSPKASRECDNVN